MTQTRMQLQPYRLPEPGTQPPHLHPPYGSTSKRGPSAPLIALPPSLSELTGPNPGARDAQLVNDLTAGAHGPALGERIVVSGRVLDEDERPVRDALIELWQCNAAGRYLHAGDQHDAPLDPNFTGSGRVATDGEGRYAFKTIHPGAYPWRNHANAWRPAHIHFSLFGAALATRLVTQMYFPGDPLLALDPIFHSVADEAARERLIARFDLASTQPDHALGYRFDIVLRGRAQTAWDEAPPRSAGAVPIAGRP
jgi:protocatechuate 3,4-dioxygenase beta subunit